MTAFLAFLKVAVSSLWGGIKWLWLFTVKLPLLILLIIGLAYLTAILQASAREVERDEAIAARNTLLQQAETLNQHQQATILDLNQKLAVCIGQNQATERTADLLASVRKELQRTLAQSRVTAQKERDAIYAQDQACSILRTVPLCDAISVRLRGEVPADPNGDY